jgi:hypothetical protein
LAGFRVFGNGGGEPPASVKGFNVDRLESDRSVVSLNWEKVPGATGYNIRYGISKDKLYHTFQVLGANSATINSLNGLQPYYFTIDAFNENGVTKGSETVEVK